MGMRITSPSSTLSDNQTSYQVTSEFVDAETGLSLGNHPLKKFIQGFSVASRRSVSAKKDGPTSVVRIGSLQPQNNSADNVWPPNNGEEFSSVLPRHTADFLKCLPIPEYTT